MLPEAPRTRVNVEIKTFESDQDIEQAVRAALEPHGFGVEVVAFRIGRF